MSVIRPLCLATALLLAGVEVAPGQIVGPGGEGLGPGERSVQPQGKPEVLVGVGFEQRLDAAVPLDAVFCDESGGKVKLGDYLGDKPAVVALVYFRCPRLCTLVLNGLTETLRAMTIEAGREFRVIAVSFDPRDTPVVAAEKKAGYLALYGRQAEAGAWRFLTGPQESIDRLTRAVGFRYTYDAKTEQFAHASGLIVITPRGRIARYLYGIDYSPRDLRLALVEASEERIGSPVDAALLYCFHYDPRTGKYTADVMRLVRLAGGATVVAIAGLVGVFWWRSRRRRVKASHG